MTIKRSVEDRIRVEELAMDNCLMILTGMGTTTSTTTTAIATTTADRIFTCKTCNKQFSSFQALGGHRASHKRPRLMASQNLHHHHDINVHSNNIDNIAAKKPKRHACSICGIEFAMGQALGGHMRRHRTDHDTEAASHTQSDCTTETALESSQKANSGGASSGSGTTTGSNRVLLLDLNLTPDENVLKFGKLDSLTYKYNSPPSI